MAECFGGADVKDNIDEISDMQVNTRQTLCTNSILRSWGCEFYPSRWSGSNMRKSQNPSSNGERGRRADDK